MSVKLTGNRRFRSERKWGKERLILQVEVSGYVIDCVGGHVGSHDVCYWRDARTEDLTTEIGQP